MLPISLKKTITKLIVAALLLQTLPIFANPDLYDGSNIYYLSDGTVLERTNKPLHLATLSAENQIQWNISTEQLKSYIMIASDIVSDCGGCIGTIDSIYINFNLEENRYVLNYNAVCKFENEQFSDYLNLNNINGDIFLDEEVPQPIIWKVAIVLIIFAASTQEVNKNATMDKKKCDCKCTCKK